MRMDIFFTILRKFLVGVTTLVFAFVLVYVPQNYNPIEKAIPVQTTHALAHGATEITQLVNTASNIAQEVKDKVLDPIAYQIAKNFISQILKSTIDWINSGFKGSPAFVQDLDQFLLDTADLAAGEYIKGLGELGSIICKPFRIDIQVALALKYQKAREDKRIDECTLSGIVDNIEDFYAGTVDREDFWEQWVEISSKPKTYTPYGQLIEAEAGLAFKIGDKKFKALEEVKFGRGFMSSKKCEMVDDPSGKKVEKCVITTPGDTIAATLNKNLGAGVDTLVAADEINELIGALFGQIANQALTGAAGLLGLSVRGGGGGGSGESYVDSLVNEANNSNGELFNQGIDAIAERLAVQIEYRALAVEYIPQLLLVSNNTKKTQEIRSRAQLSYGDAITVRDTTTQHIAKLQPWVDRYRALEAEYQTATDARKTAIRQEQSAIITRGIQYNSYTEARLEASRREWREIVSL